MKIQHLLIAAGIIAASIAMTACGSSSSSSNDSSAANQPSKPSTSTPAQPNKPATPQPSAIPACKVADGGKTVLVPNGGTCSHTNPKVNGGKAFTPSCPTGGGIHWNGIMGAVLTLGETTYKCDK